MKKNYVTIAACLFAMLFFGGDLFGQVQYKIELLPDGITYKVSMKPSVTWLPPFNLTSSGQVSVKVLHNGLSVSNLTTLVPGTSWSNNATYSQPIEAPTMDYINFGLTSTGTNAFTYTNGVEVGLFTFQNTNACIGPVMLLEANDVFLPPNSMNANVGNQLTTFGGGPGNNVWSGNYGGPANCLNPCNILITNVISTNASNCGSNNGSITVIATGTGPLQYSNNNGTTWQNSNVFSNLAPGSYSVAVKNSSCQVSYVSNPVQITAPSAPSISGVTPVSPNACGVNNGSLTISATGGSGIYQYSINGGTSWHSSGSFTSLPAGTYSPAVRNGNGTCQVTGASVVLTAPTALNVTVTPTNPTTCGGINGLIQVNASGGTGTYEYSKNNGTTWQAANIFNGLSAGIYPISVRNLGGNCTTNYGNTTLSDPVNCNSNCPVSYQLERLPNGKYQVSLIPHTTWVFPNNITSTAQVTIVVPTGSFVVSNLTNLIPGVVFANNSHITAPVENPSKDYYLFGLTSIGTTSIPYLSGVKVPLFTFENSGACTGSTIYLMDNDNDPFMAPNSLNLNPGLQLTTLGSGINAEICIAGQAAPCLPCGPGQPDSDNDGLCDVLETANGSNPNNPCSPNGADSDGDGICDVQEGLLGSDPQDPCDPNPLVGACTNDCDEIWTVDTIYMDGNGGDASICMPIQLSQLSFYDIILNNAAYSQPVEACTLDSLFFYTYAFTVGQGSAGPYMVESWDIDGNLAHSGVVADMNDLAAKMNIWNPGGNWTNNPGTKAISGGMDGQNYGTMKIRHILSNVPSVLNLNITFAPLDSKIELGGPGVYNVLVEQNVTGCADSILVIVVDPQPDTIEVVTDFRDPVSVCVSMDELPGNVASISLCEQPSGGLVTFTNDTCFVYTPNSNFSGVDEFCVVVCNDTDPQFCDTTIVSITVDGPDCDPVFNTDTIFVNGLHTAYCIPFDNSQIINSEVYLDDVLYNSLSSYCEEDTLTFYSYAFTVGQGNAGPYTVNFWNVGNSQFTGVVSSMSDLVAKMNLWDPTGNWLLNAGSSTISGGDPSKVYGVMKLTQVLTQVPTSMEPNFTLINGGFNVLVSGEGLHDIVIYDPISGCSDTLVIWLNGVEPDTLEFVIEEGSALPITCLSEAELPGGASSINFCGQPLHGSVALSNDNCFNYTPTNGFIGEDAFCLVICNGTLPQFCDTTYIFITVMPETDTIPLVLNPDDPFVYCIQPPIGQVTSASVCGENLTEINATVAANSACVTLDPADDFSGFTEVCVIHCITGQLTGAAICDTTIFTIIVVPQTDTVEVTVTNDDPTSVCVNNVLDLPGNILSGTICGFNPNQVAVTVNPNGCVNIDPVNGFIGQTEICVIYCDDSAPQLCDTTIISLEIAIPCDPIFSTNDTLVSYNPIACAPLAVGQWSLYDIILNGAPYVHPPVGCNNQVLVYYTYAFTVGQGNSGPYQISSWKVNNVPFSGTVANAAALAAQMNIWDPTGNWQFNPGTLTISGGAQGSVYDKMIVKHVLSGIPTTLLPNTTTASLGTEVTLTQTGLNEMIAIDPQTGCSDTIYIWYVDITPSTVHVVTPQNVATAPVCLDLSELQGNPLSPSLCSTPAHGTVSFNNNCLVYTPAQGYVGEESFCVVICDDHHPQFCDTTTVIVTVLPPDDVKNVSLMSGQPTNVCLGNLLQFPGQIVSTSVCAPLPQGITATPNTSGCVDLLAANGITGNMQICVRHCYIAPISGQQVCDTTYLNLTIMPGTEHVYTTLTNQDPTTFCVNSYIDLPGNIASATICGENPNEVDATANLNGCVVLDPAPGFFGTTTICVVFCDNGQPQFCDTTIIHVTMDIDCPDIFPTDSIYTNEPKICAPIAFSEIDVYDIILNGQDYLFPTTPCNEDTLVFYTYSFTIGSGNSGPYMVQSWNVNGQSHSAIVANMYELATKMNQWDPNGNWINNPNSSSLSTTNNGSTYGMMIIKHLGTNIPALLLPNYTNVALGTCVQLDGPGWNQIIVVNNETGCSDTVYVFQSGAEVNVAPRVCLQGAFDAANGLMKDNLRQLGYIPSTEPYSAMSQFTHVNGGGGETMQLGVLSVTGHDAIVDWVFLELRSVSDPTQVVATRSALIQRDGDIVDMDGFSPVSFNVADGDYHLAVRHRNHLGAMTKIPLALSMGATFVDFTAPSFQTFGTNAQRLASNKQMLWGGNANSDSRLVFQGDANDTDAVFFEVILAPGNATFSPNFIYDGYRLGDTNMDGSVIFQGINNDVDLMVFYNLLTHPQNPVYLINFIFEEQLP